MSKSTEISATQWLQVRERVVNKLKESSPQSAKDTRVRMAEHLILAGYVDVEFIAAEIAVEVRERQERVEQAQREIDERARRVSEIQEGGDA